jgi:DNA-3-methyladenine glycosylase I
MKNSTKTRCQWVTDDLVYRQYHDHEWGVPIWHDQLLFEFLILEGAQAGLSWLTILKRRDNYRAAFDGFDAEKIARYDLKKCEQLLGDAGIIRNRLKIQSTVTNAQAYLNVMEKFPSFASFIWQFVDGAPIQNAWKSQDKVPVKTAISDQMSAALKKLGFKFVGSTICYAYMQAVGMVNDHITSCFRYDICKNHQQNKLV